MEIEKMKELLLRSVEQEKLWVRQELIGWALGWFNLGAVGIMATVNSNLRWLAILNLLGILMAVWMVRSARRRLAWWKTNSELLLNALLRPSTEAMDHVLAHLNQK